MSKNISGSLNGYAKAYAKKGTGPVASSKLTREEIDTLRMDLISYHNACIKCAELIYESEKNNAMYDYLVTIKSVSALPGKI